MYQIIMLCILSKMRMKNATFTVWAQLTFVQGGKHRELVAAFQEPESPAESSCEAILSPTPDCPACLSMATSNSLGGHSQVKLVWVCLKDLKGGRGTESLSCQKTWTKIRTSAGYVKIKAEPENKS